MLKYKSQIKLRTADPDDFIKIFCESLATDLQYKFSRIYVGSDKIELENSPLSFLFLWNFFEIIKNADIAISHRNKVVTLHFCLDFSRYIIFWGIASVLVIVLEIYSGFNDTMVLAMPFLWGTVSFLFTIISEIKFRAILAKNIKLSNGILLSH